MSYRRRELRNQSAEIKTKYFIFNSKSKFLTWKYLKRWVVGRKWQFQDETKKCEKTQPSIGCPSMMINSRSSNRKWKWTDLNVAAVWRGPECPRGQERFAAMDLAPNWFSVDHRRVTDVHQRYPCNPKIDSRKILLR